MVTKVYIYQLAPNCWDEFLQLQKKADAIYSKHVKYTVNFIRDSQHPTKVAEVHSYPDLESAKTTDLLYQKEPELKKLFEQFLNMLDSENRHIDVVEGEVVQLRE